MTARSAHLPLASDLVDLLTGRPGTDSDEQAFPFLTTDPAGYPHIALLSRAELDISTSHNEVLAAIASTRTTAHLRSTGRATLIAIGGTKAHYVKLRLVQTLEENRLLGCILQPVDHIIDSLGIPLTPIGFHTSEELAEMEAWHRSSSLLTRLADVAARLVP
jgi:hypothetical protein